MNLPHELVDREYEYLLRLIFPPNTYPIVHERLFHYQWKNTSHHAESFREHCIDTARWMEVLCHEKHLLQEPKDAWNGIRFARLVGFFHDFGKPFVSTPQRHAMTGHAQVGARLFCLRFEKEIPRKSLLSLAILIDSHMCCLRNENPWTINKIRTTSVMNLYLNHFKAVPALQCLHQADSMGKRPPCPEEVSNYTALTVPYHKDFKIVVFLIGPSGSGKTTLKKKLMKSISKYQSCESLERDSVLMQFAQEGESYANVYKRVHGNHDLKKTFQQRWMDLLHDAALNSKARVLLVDTSKNYYCLDTSPFHHHFRIGMYCVPMNFIHRYLHGKASDVKFPPPAKWGGYRPIMTETKEERWELEVGTGVWQAIPVIVWKYFFRYRQIPLYQQPTLASLWNRYSHLDAIFAQFNPKGISLTEKHDLGGPKIYLASYKNGMDVTYGPTRYYRGEWILKTGNQATLLRSGLPTFNQKFNRGEKMIVTPKYDGSLVNILYVPEENEQFHLLKKHFPEAFHWKGHGLLCVGSRQTLLMDSALRQRFDEVLEMEFESFIASYVHYLKDTPMTLHFEMMLEQFSAELTVYYPKNFIKFLGTTTFTNNEVRFELAHPTDFCAVEQREFRDIAALETYVAKEHERLLEGDESCEPEGFVVYVYNDWGLIDIVKWKFEEYYAAHKPKCHREAFERLLQNPLLKDRFQKCRQAKDIKIKLEPLVQELECALKTHSCLDKKALAFYLREHKDKFIAWQNRINEMAKESHIKAINIQGVMFQHFPNVEEMISNIMKPFKPFMAE